MTIPRGELESFGTYLFITGRSKLQKVTRKAKATYRPITGKAYPLQAQGRSQVPVDSMELTWDYLILAQDHDDFPAGKPTVLIERETSALAELLETQTAGLAAAVDTLSVYSADGDTLYSATARLVDYDEQEWWSTMCRVSLTFATYGAFS